MDPFVCRIAGDLFEGGGHGDPFVVVGGVFAGQKIFRNAGFAEDFPDVVVCGGLGVPQIREVAVFGESLDIAVVMGVNDGEVFDGGVELLGFIAAEEVVFV